MFICSSPSRYTLIPVFCLVVTHELQVAGARPIGGPHLLAKLIVVVVVVLVMVMLVTDTSQHVTIRGDGEGIFFRELDSLPEKLTV